jgi:hypothetical protein
VLLVATTLKSSQCQIYEQLFFSNLVLPEKNPRNRKRHAEGGNRIGLAGKSESNSFEPVSKTRRTIEESTGQSEHK